MSDLQRTQLNGEVKPQTFEMWFYKDEKGEYYINDIGNKVYLKNNKGELSGKSD